MNHRYALAGFLVAGALGVSGCNPFPATCRLRLTLEIATPYGQQTASTVIQFRAQEQIHFAGSNRFRTTTSGEAVLIPVGKDIVFGALKDSIGSTLVRASLLDAENSESWLDDIKRVSAKAATEPTYDLPQEDWPDLVRFADRNVPESIQPVCMNLRLDQKDKEELRGPCSIRIIRATVTPTRDRITRGVLDYLPWLTTRHGSMDAYRPDRGGNARRPEQRLSNHAFLRGLDGQP